jgi:hypothetical protein
VGKSESRKRRYFTPLLIILGRPVSEFISISFKLMLDPMARNKKL